MNAARPVFLLISSADSTYEPGGPWSTGQVKSSQGPFPGVHEAYGCQSPHPSGLWTGRQTDIEGQGGGPDPSHPHPPDSGFVVTCKIKRAVQLFDGRRRKVFSQARCAASCARSHSYVRARREVLETSDLPSFLM